jgi:D-glycero-D-manno-heptose 1,7-bisphosphate phosphatase
MARGETEGALKRAVFLDRDGTINEEKEYLHRVEDFAFIPGAPQAIRRLREAGFLVIVVTNQSGVARGYFSVDAVHRLHRHLQEELAKSGAAVDGFYLCPHHPREGVGEFRIDCSCRKGNPGMLLQAAADHAVDLAASFMVGDKAADIEAGLRAGCRPLLVLTGYGESEAAGVSPSVPRFGNLSAAVDFILAEGGRTNQGTV